MTKPVFVVELRKAQPLTDDDGALTGYGMTIAHQYAKEWVAGRRSLAMERQYPELAGFFYDLRSDAVLARTHAAEES